MRLFFSIFSVTQSMGVGGFLPTLYRGCRLGRLGRKKLKGENSEEKSDGGPSCWHNWLYISGSSIMSRSKSRPSRPSRAGGCFLCFCAILKSFYRAPLFTLFTSYSVHIAVRIHMHLGMPTYPRFYTAPSRTPTREKLYIGMRTISP